MVIAMLVLLFNGRAGYVSIVQNTEAKEVENGFLHCRDISMRHLMDTIIHYLPTEAL